ncbi:MAG TPA: hypothetical protein VGG75_28055 [Trebonia sp.]
MTTTTTTAAFALLSLFSILSGTSSAARFVPVLTVISIVVFIICTVVVSGLGHKVLVFVQRWATWVFGALNIVVMITLLTRIGGRYWYRAGIEPRAVAAWALAIVAGYLFTVAGTSDDPWVTGPFAHSRLGTNGLGWVITFVVAAAVYAALGGTRQTEVPAQPAAAAEEPAR